MKTFLTMAVVAALFGAVATELSLRLLPGSHLGLLLTVVVACFATAAVSLRVANRAPAAAAPARAQQPSRRDEGKRESGTVKWFNRTKGFGFIIRENGDEIFVHHRSIRSDGSHRASLKDGQQVSFSVVKRDKGWQAEDVTSASG